MRRFVRLDVSLEKAAICIVSEYVKIAKEGQVASEPWVLLRWIRAQGGRIAAIGFEVGPFSQWRIWLGERSMTATLPLPKSCPYTSATHGTGSAVSRATSKQGRVSAAASTISDLHAQ